jgi:hypothetical protein
MPPTSTRLVRGAVQQVRTNKKQALKQVSDRTRKQIQYIKDFLQKKDRNKKPKKDSDKNDSSH